MPNIHMIGFMPSEYRRLKEIVDQTMQGLGLGDDAVRTYVEALVRSCDGKHNPMPYIAVTSTKKEEIDTIIGALQAAGIKVDCEKGPVIIDFVEGKDMCLPES